VQSKRVRKYNLNDGDVVQIGKHEIMYIDERTPQQRRGGNAGGHTKAEPASAPEAEPASAPEAATESQPDADETPPTP
jgi:pyruvate/2-oxoglutarate dehydrogenase complex dihydrolipoamide acyltransferase (E2) component